MSHGGMHVLSLRVRMDMMIRYPLFAISVLFGAAQVWAMDAMPDAELSTATGQDGIAAQFEVRINTDGNGNPLTNTTVLSSVANASDYTNCASLTNLSSTGCRLALKFANHNDNGGEWLVAKNFYGRIVMPLVYIDSGNTPASPSAYADLDRFKDKNGAPLLATPNNIPLVKISYPKEIEIWNLTIGGLGIEYGASGYLNNANKSFGGVKIGNSVPSMPATINAQGSIGIFGF